MWTSIIKWVGHWAVYFVLSAIVVWGLYAGLIRPITKPNPTNVQNGGTSYTVHVGFGGCARLPEVKPNPITPIVEKAKEIKEVITK
jgi:hypothetical protein